jgi:hypothetical protein
VAKLVATYTEGFFAVFTENRTGMQQRALIDIGDKVPTPKEMAELAGVLSDQWGWGNVIERAPSSKAKAIDEPKRAYVSPKESGEPVGDIRKQMILDYVATHPKASGKEILEGLGWESTHARISRWQHAFTALIRANQLVAETVAASRIKLYSLP